MIRSPHSPARRAACRRLIAAGVAAALPAALFRNDEATAAEATAPVVRALVGGRVIDGSGAPPIDDATVVIEGERITAVGPSAAVTIPPGAEIVSTEGQTVLPGLIDLQVRLSRLGHANPQRWDDAYVPLAQRVVMPIAARQLLMQGVTSARDVGSPLEAAISVRDRIRDRRIPGPTLWVGGPVLEASAPLSALAYRWSLQGAADAREKAERLLRAGVDYLLIADADRLGAAEVAAVVAAAKLAGRPVYAEVRRDTDVAPALAAGVTGLLGLGNGIGDAWPESVLQALRERAAQGAAVPWTAGASVLTNFEHLRANREPLDEARTWEGMPPIVAQDVKASLVNLAGSTALEMPAARRPQIGSRLKSARAAGARLLVGSDAGAPAQLHTRATWQEIETLVLDGGVPPLEAIAAATSGAAALLGVQHEVGTLAPGKYADVIVVRGDPLRHVERLQDVEVVIRRGQRWR